MATAKKTTKDSKSESKEFAVILTGGKQYKVAVGDVLKVEKLDGEFNVGYKEKVGLVFSLIVGVATWGRLVYTIE